MPLTNLIRMTNGELDATQERASNSSIPSTRPETDFCELVWNNGQIMMQGQSSKASKGLPTTTDFQSFMHKSQVGRDANGLKLNKFTTMDSVLGDFPLAVPSCEMGLGQDADMVPWLSYPVEDSLHNDYTCDFLPELSGVTMNDLSTDNHLSFREKKSACHVDGHHNSANLKRSNALDTEKYGKSEGSEVPQFAVSSQLNIPRSGVSGITGDNVGNTYNVGSREFNGSSLNGFTSLRLQKLDAGHPSTSSSFTNFPYFSRPAALAKANNFNISTSKRLGNDEQRCTVTSHPSEPALVNFASACSRKEIATNDQSVQAPVNTIQELMPKKTVDEPLMVKRTMRNDVVMNDAEQNQALDATVSKVVTVDERNTEPVVAASSVCSGNSVDRASNERAYDLKRKSRETTESDGPSEEAEDESVGAKKAAHARASSKRTRAAEVHNLSERRRRDRINEKMRALQELIPNCNKVDKASMLDEAIEYLKTLQLQVQMLSMGAGMYMQPMMLPPGMQAIHGAQIPHFPPMGLGMGMGMGFGMNMLDVNGGMKMIPFQGPHYPVPGAAAAFHGMPGPGLQPFGHPGQGLQMSLQRAPLHQIPGAPPGNIPMGLNTSGVAGSSGASNLPPSSSAKGASEQVMPNNFPNQSLDQPTTKQATLERNQPSAPSHDRRQAVNAPETSLGAQGANNVA